MLSSIYCFLKKWFWKICVKPIISCCKSMIKLVEETFYEERHQISNKEANIKLAENTNTNGNHIQNQRTEIHTNDGGTVIKAEQVIIATGHVDFSSIKVHSTNVNNEIPRNSNVDFQDKYQTKQPPKLQNGKLQFAAKRKSRKKEK